MLPTNMFKYSDFGNGLQQKFSDLINTEPEEYALEPDGSLHCHGQYIFHEIKSMNDIVSDSTRWIVKLNM